MLKVKFRSAFPFTAWGTVGIVLASSDSLITNHASSIKAEWTFIERLYQVGVCGSSKYTLVVQNATTLGVGMTGISINYTPACRGSITQLPDDPAYAPLLPRLVQANNTATFGLSEELPSDLTLRFDFTHSNCGDVTSFRREVDWLTALQSAGLKDVFSICPYEMIQIDATNNCVNYICNGNFTMLKEVGNAQANDVRDNIQQGIVFDAVATAVDLLGVILELGVLPFFLGGTALGAVASSQPIY
jgi:hypothetical protein